MTKELVLVIARFEVKLTINLAIVTKGRHNFSSPLDEKNLAP